MALRTIAASRLRTPRCGTGSSYAFYKRHARARFRAPRRVAITPVNLPEMTAMPMLQADFDHQHIQIGALYCPT